MLYMCCMHILSLPVLCCRAGHYTGTGAQWWRHACGCLPVISGSCHHASVESAGGPLQLSDSELAARTGQPHYAALMGDGAPDSGGGGGGELHPLRPERPIGSW
jgi:hypothetical protein